MLQTLDIPIMRRHVAQPRLRCMIASMVLLLVPGPPAAGAQGSVLAYETDVGLVKCGSKDLLQQSQVSLDCVPNVVGGTAFTAASASATNGTLRAYAAAQFLFDTAGEVTQFVQARWDDQALAVPIAAGPVANRLEIGFGVSGFTAAGGTDMYNSGQYSSSIGGYDALGAFNAISANELSDPRVNTSIRSGSGYRGNLPGAGINSTVVFSLLLDSYGNSNPFYYDVNAATDAFRNIYYFQSDPLTGSVEADFANTVIPLYYRVLDANENDITANYDVRFANGMMFGGATTTALEPSSLALLGTGIFGLAGFRGRRRGRA